MDIPFVVTSQNVCQSSYLKYFIYFFLLFMKMLDVFVGNTTVSWMRTCTNCGWMDTQANSFLWACNSLRTFPFNISGDDTLFILVNSQRCSENADGSSSLSVVWSQCRRFAQRHRGPVQDIPDVWAAPTVPFQSGQSASFPEPSSPSNHAYWEVCGPRVCIHFL